VVSRPRLVPADVDPAAVLCGLHADEPVKVVLAHVDKLVLVPRIPEISYVIENPSFLCVV